ncbi:MAG TPA: AraC family transcriptional regulator [Phormidium sp.]
MLYINKDLIQEMKVANLAALLGMSRFYLSHLFKEAIGTAPYEYLLQQRILRGRSSC